MDRENKHLHPEMMFLVVGLSRMFDKEMRKVCEENGVPVGYRELLRELGHCDGCGQRSLAENVGIKPSSASIALDKMERDGYIYREQSEFDRRAVKVYLTEKGKSVNAKNKERLAALEKEFASTITSTEEEEVKRILEKVIAGFCAERGQEYPPMRPHTKISSEMVQVKR